MQCAWKFFFTVVKMYIQGNYQTSMCWLTQAYNKDQSVTLQWTNWTSKLNTGNTIQISQVSNSMHTIALAENKNKCGGKWITLIRNWYHYDTHKLWVTRIMKRKGKGLKHFIATTFLAQRCRCELQLFQDMHWMKTIYEDVIILFMSRMF